MRVVVVEDQRLLLDILADALAGHQVQVVGRARDLAEALQAVDDTAPDVAILDIRLPPAYTDEGLRAAELLRVRHPDLGLLVLSSYAEVAYAERLLTMEEDSRSIGYLLKERVGNLTELVEALRRIAAGEVVIDSYVIDRLMARRRAHDPLAVLTAHERRVLALVAEGRSNLGIAQHLGCQISTIEKHVSAITDKLGLPSAGDRSRPGVNVRVLATLAFLRGGEKSPVADDPRS
jgi:DNA-binding NarL/FixJ family response regulator